MRITRELSRTVEPEIAICLVSLQCGCGLCPLSTGALPPPCPQKRCIAMKVTLFQQDIVWGSPSENMRRAEKGFAEALGCGDGNASNKETRRADDLSGSVVPAPQTSAPQTSVPQMSASQTLSKVVSGYAGRVDLIVLPEMFTTGFCVDPSHTADVIDDGSAAVAWMRRMAVRYDAAVAGSVAVADGERYLL